MSRNALSAYAPDAIVRFRESYRFLSNFFVAPIAMPADPTIGWPSVEHGYQALLAADPSDRDWIVQAPSPGEAKKRARKCRRREGADDLRIPLMRELVHLKFTQHPVLRQKLLDTGSRELVEGNTWGDTFWGVDEVRGGQNVLGQILMNQREIARNTLA